MRQFVIPQFIDEESHILGPIVVRQFIIILIVGFFIFLSYRLADFALFIILTIFFTVIGGALAFVKVNGRPFHYFLLNLLQTLGRPRLRVWKKQISTQELRDEIALTKSTETPVPPVLSTKPALASSRLSELSLIVDTGGAYRGENR